MNGDDLSIAVLITTLLSFILPPLVSFLRATTAPPWVSGALFFLLCFIGAALAMWAQKEILNPPAFDTRADYVRYYLLNLLAVITQARVWYSTFWKTLGAGATQGLEQTGPKIGENQT